MAIALRNAYLVPMVEYFCVFCKSFNFEDRACIETHLRTHLNICEEQELDLQLYQEKWIKYHLDDQEELFQSNKNFENGFRIPTFNFSKIHDGCPLCDILIERYGVHPDAKRVTVDVRLKRNSRNLYDHIYKHMSFVNFCVSCDFKDLRPKEIMRHINEDHSELEYTTFLSLKLLPQLITFIKQYVQLLRECGGWHTNGRSITLESKIFWKNPKERQYFCIFCPNLRFGGMIEIETHLKDHFNYTSTSPEDTRSLYLTKWLKTHLTFQENIFKANSKPQKSLLLIFGGDAKVEMRVWEGCLVCKLICDIFNYEPEQQYYVRPENVKNYGRNLHSHMQIHLRCDSFCSACDFKRSRKRNEVMRHIKVVHNSKCDALTWSLTPEIRKLVCSYIKKFEQTFDPSFFTNYPVDNNFPSTSSENDVNTIFKYQFEPSDSEDEPTVILQNDSQPEITVLPPTIPYETIFRDYSPEPEFEIEDDSDSDMDEDQEARSLKVFWDPKKDREYFCLFCPEETFTSLKCLECHLHEHFPEESAYSTSKDYLDKWIPCYLGFQSLLFHANSKPRLTPAFTIYRDCLDDKVWDGCFICQRLMNIFGFYKEADFEKCDNSNLKVHIFNHLQCKTFCLICKKSFPQPYSLEKHMKSAHKTQESKCLSWTSLPTLESFIKFMS